MYKLAALAALAVSSLWAQYTVEPAAAPPADLAVTATLAKNGVKVLKEDGSVLCELWLRAELPSGGRAEPVASFTTIPHGALLGVVRFPGRHYDRRGQMIRPGVYTLRYSLFVQNGDHQGVAPQRDFFVLSPAESDTDAAATPAYEPLMNMSRKASHTPHPLVLSIWKSEAATPEGFAMHGDHDGVLTLKLGAVKLSVILIGKHEG